MNSKFGLWQRESSLKLNQKKQVHNTSLHLVKNGKLKLYW